MNFMEYKENILSEGKNNNERYKLLKKNGYKKITRQKFVSILKSKNVVEFDGLMPEKWTKKEILDAIKEDKTEFYFNTQWTNIDTFNGGTPKVKDVNINSYAATDGKSVLIINQKV